MPELPPFLLSQRIGLADLPSEAAVALPFSSVPFGSLPLETLFSYLDARSGLQRNLSGASLFLSWCLSPVDSKVKNSGGSVIHCPNALCEGKGDL